MIETILKVLKPMIDPVIVFYLEITINPYLAGILAALLIFHLLIIVQRRRKNRQFKGFDDPSLSSRMDETMSRDAAAFDEEEKDDHFHDADIKSVSGADGYGEDGFMQELYDRQWEGPDDSEEAQPCMKSETASISAPLPPRATAAQKPAAGSESPTPAGLFERLKSGLSKTRQNFSRKFEGILSGNQVMDDDMMEAIEEALITADVGVPTTMELIKRIAAQTHGISDTERFKTHLKQEMLSFVSMASPVFMATKPYVIMMVGVNGAGKTTTIGKLASRYAAEGKKVLLAAADTFRAAAADQLSIWAQRAGADIVRQRDNADPAAVAYDGIDAALARGIDVVIVDTAGRLQTKVNLMEQLKKIKRSIDKALPGAPHEVMLVLDATTGQNAVSQARLFDEGIGVTGIVLAKLDGTAKGGIVISICHTLKIPIRYIGIGEGIDDLQAFDPERFIDALL